MNDVLVLVVDDEVDHRELIVNALARRCDRGRIAVAASGDEALDFLFCRGAHAHRDPRKPPRLIILDLAMSPKNGVQVLSELRADARTSALPVVVLSAASEKSELDACYAAGANSVVRKSPRFDELQHKVETVYDFWVTVNEVNRSSRV